MVSRYLVIIAGCIFVQALEATFLNGSNNKTASNNADEAIKKLCQAIKALSTKELDNFDKHVIATKRFLDMIVPRHKEELYGYLREVQDTLTQLEKQGQEKKIDIAECLDGKLDKFKALGPPFIKEVEDCVAFTYKAANVTRGVMNVMFHSLYLQAVDLSYDINQCENDECLNQIAKRAESLLEVLLVKVSSIAEMGNSLLITWDSGTFDCFLHQKNEYLENKWKILLAARNCVNEKVASKI